MSIATTTDKEIELDETLDHRVQLRVLMKSDESKVVAFLDHLEPRQAMILGVLLQQFGTRAFLNKSKENKK